MLEWSADCNNDGIVDYGQCRDGTLPDFDGNNVPDCCEHGNACVAGNYPVQWRLSEGGNGHWYQMLIASGKTGWIEAKRTAELFGGQLATITSEAENLFVSAVAANQTGWRGTGDFHGPWLGGFQDRSAQDYQEPGGGWRWVTGETWRFTAWGDGLPNNAGDQGYLHLYSLQVGEPGSQWDDIEENFVYPPIDGPLVVASIVEWSADCNSDGIVDYGQILTRQLADSDSNGVPDICQQPTCVAADIYRDFNVNGADLGILLSQWGPNTPLTESDLNSDGVVNGADLGILLSFWGACP
jgi:hypothetical protein